MNTYARDTFENRFDSQFDLRLPEKFSTFVMTAYVKSCGTSGVKPLSGWLSSRCLDADYEVDHASVLCDVFINQECEVTDDSVEALESLTKAEIGKALAGDWDTSSLDFAAAYQEPDMALNAAVSEVDAARERDEFLRRIEELKADGETNQDGLIDLIVESPEYELPPETGTDFHPFNSEESLDESKARWDRAIGMTSCLDGNNRFVYCSPTGFPLADMELYPDGTGRFEASFGHPISMQNDWLKESRP